MTDPTRPVVAGVDGSAAGLWAARWAAREAVRRRATLRLVHVMREPDSTYVIDPDLEERYRGWVRDAARERLAAARVPALDAAPDVQITDDLTAGSPARVLVEMSAGAQLMVLGGHGTGAVIDLVLGSVALSVAAHAACPVVVLRGTETGAVDPAPVVVGVDGSPVSEAALAFAFETASIRDVPLVAVHTWWGLLTDPAAAPFVDLEAADAAETEVLAERLAGWSAKFPDVAVRRVVEPDQAGRALVQWSQNAQLVVVGSRGRGAAAGLMLGSVSQTLLHHAGCPVAVVRPERGTST